ncbi:hypothetical protein A2Z67_00885 [Candidatus Woesebacteria bacterium RBG_13_36_22]|uniref:Uncharacterized protein n=1 Tax=Candidatus Woesebacteria bacterium RBG_13_36_22 TaxID=1802478 RepID=A0A1F7X5W2_9BACT|nr:MAG: hypothetical protein A2Z67_00885 [Candidatus Woesebacteria bacterium RBG_13_36_22]
MNESHEAIKIERDLTLNISPGSVADLLPDNLIRGSGDFRDTTVVVLRHADEEEDQSSQTLMLSSEGERQIDSTVGQLVDCLNNAGEPITLKFYSSPKEYAKITAGRIIKELEELQLEGKLSEGVRLLKSN